MEDVILNLERRVNVLERLITTLKAEVSETTSLSPRKASELLGVSYNTVIKLITEAEAKRALKQKSKLKYGEHYWIINPAATRVTYRINFEKFQEVLKNV